MSSNQVDLFEIYPEIFDRPETIIEKAAAPILKWAGGKRQLLAEFFKFLPSTFNRYYEPFIGGGAFLFALSPPDVVVNDYNEELINVYRTVKSNVHDLIKLLEEHKSKDSKDYYYNIRNVDRDVECYSRMSDIDRAARFIYLNKTCFNGLYRVNKKNQFNVPRGGAIDPDIVNEQGLLKANLFFNSRDVTFLNGDFREAVTTASKDDFVYMDPPYDVLTKQSFVDYTNSGFNRDMQVVVRETLDELTQKGVMVMLSNSATDFIKDLYKDYTIHLVDAPRYVGASESSRGKVEEVLVINYA